MNVYETILILGPNLDENAVDQAVGRVKGIISNHSGEILKSDNWGKKKLAYIIKKENRGHYVLLVFKAQPTVISEFERFFKVTDQFLKSMTIKLNKKQVEAVMSSLAKAAAKEAPSAPEQPPREVTEKV